MGSFCNEYKVINQMREKLMKNQFDLYKKYLLCIINSYNDIFWNDLYDCYVVKILNRNRDKRKVFPQCECEYDISC